MSLHLLYSLRVHSAKWHHHLFVTHSMSGYIFVLHLANRAMIMTTDFRCCYSTKQFSFSYFILILKWQSRVKCQWKIRKCYKAFEGLWSTLLEYKSPISFFFSKHKCGLTSLANIWELLNCTTISSTVFYDLFLLQSLPSHPFFRLHSQAVIKSCLQWFTF